MESLEGGAIYIHIATTPRLKLVPRQAVYRPFLCFLNEEQS